MGNEEEENDKGGRRESKEKFVGGNGVIVNSHDRFVSPSSN